MNKQNLLRGAMLLVASCTLSVILSFPLSSFARAAALPNPVVDVTPAPAKTQATAVLAGGCFWGVEGVFEHVKGVSDVVSGYAGGDKSTAHYDDVSTGTTGHAESVKITYDPSQVTYGQLLKIYFAVAHDPTELNRQGPDTGTQYRSSIFYANDEQKKIADSYILQLEQAHVFRSKIVTQVVPLKGFYRAEDHHQHFLQNNPNYPYIVFNDMPKIHALQKEFPEMCKR